MVILGTGLLAFCLLLGICAGELLGQALGIDANVGGVGIAMLALIVATDWLQRRGALPQPTRQGVLFWSAVYIPIVVAMAASQDVRAAVTGGPAAIAAGVASVAVCVALAPVISRMGRPAAGAAASRSDGRERPPHSDDGR